MGPSNENYEPLPARIDRRGTAIHQTHHNPYSYCEIGTFVHSNKKKEKSPFTLLWKKLCVYTHSKENGNGLLCGVKGGVTFHQLLGRERDEGMSAQRPLSLQVSHGAECPARPHRTLVFDTRDHTLLSPVKRV